MCKRSIYLCLFIFCSVLMYGQITVMPGTNVNIASGTVVSLNSTTEDTLKIASGASVINNGSITLGQTIIVSEQPGSPITGNGYEEYSTIYSAPLSGVDPGGLGLILSSNAATDSLTIRRTHLPLINSGSPGVSRSYKVVSENNSGLNADADFNYDMSELNGNTSSELMMYQSFDGGTNWSVLDGNAFSGHVQSASGIIDSFSLFSLFSFAFRIDSLNALSFYHGDSIKIYYTLNGSLNAGNSLVFQFSDTAGSFAVPFTLDSIPSVNGQGVLTKAIPVVLDPGTEYRLRLKTTDISMISADNGNDITILPPLPTSVPESEAVTDVYVYPNPASELVFVKGRNIRRISISDKLGRAVIEKFPEGNSSGSIDLSGLAPAVYLITVEDSGRTVNRKLIKN